MYKDRNELIEDLVMSAEHKIKSIPYLTEREAFIIIDRLHGNKTFEATSKSPLLPLAGELSKSTITGSRARQIYVRTIRKLNHPANRKTVWETLNV